MAEVINHIHQGDCIEVMRTFPANFVDTIITDPPYLLTNDSGNGFMGNEWDSVSPSNAVAEAYFKSCEVVLNMVADGTVAPPVSTLPSETENPASNVPYAAKKSGEAQACKSQNTHSVAASAITKAEALALCSVVCPSLTTVVAELPSHAVFVQSSFWRQLVQTKNIVPLIVSTLQNEPEWLGSVTTSTRTEAVNRNVIGGPNGHGLGELSISETDTPASDAESTATEKSSSATTSSRTAFQKTIQKVISLPCVRPVIRRCTEIQSFTASLSASFHHRWAVEAFRIAKPGATMLCFGGPRTFHRTASAIEDAGWIVKDCISWIFGSGFPKSLDISKAIDKAKGAEREVIGQKTYAGPAGNGASFGVGNLVESDHKRDLSAPATDLAREWNGWGTALKPAWEPILVAMKPLDGTFAENAEKWGVAGINVDGGRIATDEDRSRPPRTPNALYGGGNGTNLTASESNPKGRWPANLLLDEESAAALDRQSGHLHPSANKSDIGKGADKSYDASSYQVSYAGRANRDYGNVGGGASRFFYVAKASRSERNEGCEGLETLRPDAHNLSSNACGKCGLRVKANGSGQKCDCGESRETVKLPMPANHHPTVKPLKLMEYLCTLTKTPTGGIVLDPFAGSGSTLIAAERTGRPWIGIEMNADYVAIANARLSAGGQQMKMAI